MAGHGLATVLWRLACTNAGSRYANVLPDNFHALVISNKQEERIEEDSFVCAYQPANTSSEDKVAEAS